jgi:hypothetical protein
MWWTHIDLGAQDFKIAGSKVLDEYYKPYLRK